MTELTTEIISINKLMERNIKKFPQDFMFQLTKDEALIISRFQNGPLKQGHNVKYLPYVFTEYGAMQS